MYHTKKRIKGRYYWYLQHSRREGKRVKTTSIYIGPVGAAVGILKVGIKVATSKYERQLLGKSAEELMKSHEQPKGEFTVAELGFREDWDAVKEFEHESGIKSAHHEGASSSQPSSDEG